MSSISESGAVAFTQALEGYLVRFPLVAGSPDPTSPPFCPKHCPCLRAKPAGDDSTWSRTDTTHARDRQRRAYTLMLQTTFPLDLARSMSNVWMLPHRWALGPWEGGVEWNRETAELLLAEAGDTHPPAGSDPLLCIFRLGGHRFPLRVLWSAEGGVWRDWQDCIGEILELGSGISKLPFKVARYCDHSRCGENWSPWLVIPDDAQPSMSIVRASDRVGTLSHVASASSHFAGEVGELMVQEVLHGAAVAHYPLARVVRTGHRPRSGDFQVALAEGTFLVEVKNYTRAVPTKEVEKLCRDLEASGARGGILISLGSGVAGVRCPGSIAGSILNPAGFSVEMVPASDGQMRPLLIVVCPAGAEISSQSNLSHVCSLTLATVALLATNHPHSTGRPPETRVLESLALQLERAETNVSRVLGTQQESTQAALAIYHQGLAALTTVRTSLAALGGQVRAELGGVTHTSQPKTWEVFRETVGAMHEPEAVFQIWTALRGDQRPWTFERKSAARSMSCQANGDCVTFRFLTTATRCVVPIAFLRQYLAVWLLDPILQKSLTVAPASSGSTCAIQLDGVVLPYLVALVAGWA
jgi:hypothetical protein